VTKVVPRLEAYSSFFMFSFFIDPILGPANMENSLSGNDLLSWAVIVKENNKAAMKIRGLIRIKNGFCKYTLYILLFVCHFSFFSQVPDKIQIKKDIDFSFYQAGKKTDTISVGTGDKFYLKLSADLRCITRIEVVNGRLYKTSNDTIFQLKKVPNLQYEHYFSDSVFVSTKPKGQNKPENCYKFVTHINGAQEGNGSTITIQFYTITNRETILVKKYYFK